MEYRKNSRWLLAIIGILFCSHVIQAQTLDNCQSRNFSATEQNIADAYIAYYGRPADPGGLAWWLEEIGEGGDVGPVIDDFGNSDEYRNEFSALDDVDLVNNIYQHVLGRAGDAEGMQFYMDKLQQKEYTLPKIAIAILHGAIHGDAPTVLNRRKAVRYFVTKAENGRAKTSLSPRQLRDWLASVSSEAASVNAACQALDTWFQDAAPPPSSGAPRIQGRLIYHTYSTYEARDAQMFWFDFETGEHKNISKDWNIRHAMNAHFSPDGNKIIFMGLRGDKDTWDIYLYDLTRQEHPVNLTPDDMRNEDPRFSPDGRRMIFKRNLRLAEMHLETGEIVSVLPEDGHEYSMPDYNMDGTRVVASRIPDGQGNGCCSEIVAVDLQRKTVTQLYDIPDVPDYFPVNADATSFYYSQGYSAHWRGDQVYRGFWDGRPSERLPFNAGQGEANEGDYSDASPAGGDWVVISSTRPGTRGSYDLYLANTISGEVISMSDYHPDINTVNAELGPVIFIRP